MTIGRLGDERPMTAASTKTITRTLSYRKDDRAMRPVYGWPANFRWSLTMPRATFPQIFNGLLFRLSLLMCVQNLKFIPVPEITGGNQKIGQSLDMPTLPFLQNISWAYVRMDPVNVLNKFEVCSFTRSRELRY